MTDASETSAVEDAYAAGEADGSNARWPSSLLLLLSAFGLCTLAFTVAARAAFPWPLE
jgi:hypothetical protein